MKPIFNFLILILVLPASVIAQKTVTAESIIADINKHTPVILNDVQVTGDLNLTKLDDMKAEPKESGSDKIYISRVTSSVSFANCSFTGKVLGYFNPDEGKPYVKHSTLYNANFTAVVSFEDCTFEKEVNFKYSLFNDAVLFKRCHFNDDAVFKYTKFEKGPKFTGSAFKGDATFKYVDFPKDFDFSNVIFENEADFKYAKFMNDGNFTNAVFKDGADFKYAGFSKSVSFKGASFNGTSDLKYTTLNNQKTNLNELLNK